MKSFRLNCGWKRFKCLWSSAVLLCYSRERIKKLFPSSNEISLIWWHRSTIYGLLIDPYNDQLPVCLIVQLVEHCTSITEIRVRVPSRGLFLESPETFRAYFGWHNSLCIFKTKASRGTKLCSYFCFYSLCNIWKDQLYRISRSEFYEWLFGPEKFSGLSGNGPQAWIFYVFLSLLLK